MQRTGILCLLSLFPLRICLAQEEVKVSIVPLFDGKPLELGRFYPFEKRDSIRIETLKFYMSEPELLMDDRTAQNEKNLYRLVDASNEKSLHFSLKTKTGFTFNHIHFTLGIDSITQVSGAMGGDLDPTKGMYWTWDNGYIHAKIEGQSTRCATRNREFQVHLGGYRSEVNTCKMITLPVKPATEIRVLIDLKTVLAEVDLAKTHHIMSAGKEAVRISSLLAKNLKTN